jgi:hypothetical protein
MVSAEGNLIIVASERAEKVVKSPKASKACETLFRADFISFLKGSDILPPKSSGNPCRNTIVSRRSAQSGLVKAWKKKERKKQGEEGEGCRGYAGYSGLLEKGGVLPAPN